MVLNQMNANSLLNASYLYTESSFPTESSFSLAFPAIPVGIDKRTSKLAYPATEVLNSFSPRREISHTYYACENRALTASERTSELAYPATVVLNSFSPRRERLAMPAMPG